MAIGRPREYDRERIGAAFEQYITDTPIPIVAEFAASQGVTKQFMYDCEEFSDLVKQCTCKKEGALERGMLSSSVNVTAAIFSLKQLGWSDRQDITHKGDAQHPLMLSNSDAKL